MSLKNSIITLLILFVAASCKKESSPIENTIGQGDMFFFAKASGTGIKTLATTKSDSVVSNTVVVNWSSASMYVDKISFTAKINNSVDTTTSTISVGKNINIFSADALAGIINLPSGSYKDVKAKLLLRKNSFPELAFYLKGTFTNTNGVQDSITVASSLPVEVNLAVTNLTINPSDGYNVTFNFDLNKILTGISTRSLQTIRPIVDKNNRSMYYIWKGGSAEEPFFFEVTRNWQTVASVSLIKK